VGPAPPGGRVCVRGVGVDVSVFVLLCLIKPILGNRY